VDCSGAAADINCSRKWKDRFCIGEGLKDRILLKPLHFAQEGFKLRNVLSCLRVFYLVSDVLEQAAEISI
jgi:hypothetical protein